VGQASCLPRNGGQDARPTRPSSLSDIIFGNQYKGVRIVLQGDFLQYQGDFLQTLGIVADERLADYPTIEEKRSEAQRLLRAHAWKSSVGDDFPLVV